MNEIFNAFRHTSYKNVKVVILGQDPYHGENEAEGLSFSVKVGIRKPPSLNNIFKELKDDLGYEYPKSGSLVKWADEGVLLLNSVLTVEKDTELRTKLREAGVEYTGVKNTLTRFAAKNVGFEELDSVLKDKDITKLIREISVKVDRLEELVENAEEMSADDIESMKALSKSLYKISSKF